MRMENSSWFNREEIVAWCEIWNKQINKEEKVILKRFSNGRWLDWRYDR